MNIQSFSLGQMQANCYLLEEDGKALLIDPADSADFILEQIQRQNLELIGIIATHGHFDHVMAVGEIQLSYPHLSLHMNKKDAFLLKRVSETAKHFLGFDPTVVPVKLTADLPAGAFNIDDFQFEVLHTPGHTPGSSSLYFKDQGILFSGDTLFQGGIGRYDFSYSDKDELKHSLQHILKLPPETRVLPGHGEETLIDYEKAIIDLYF